jgi:GMP synthase-like glutamine amidotransferase
VNVHYLQHVPYEGVGWIQDWARSRGHALSGSLMYAEGAGAAGLPDPDSLDMLVIMGGPMNIYEYDEHPWLRGEKAFIRACIDRGRAVLGICLGGQLVADVLGGEVTRAPFEEIGWYAVELTEEGRQLEVFAHFPDCFTTLQWHGDTFSIPPGAIHAAFSEATPNQAFSYDDERVIGLQFHLEETRVTLAELIGVAGKKLAVTAPVPAAAEAGAADDSFAPAGSPELARSPWVSPLEDLLAPDAPFDACRDMLFGLLDRMVMR